MHSAFRILHAGRIYARAALAWWRGIGNRNGTDDARRARARRLFIQQNCTGLTIGAYPDGGMSPLRRTRLPEGT